MAKTKQQENMNIDFIFEKKEENKESSKEIFSEEDKKIEFLLENNLLTQIGKLEEIGFELKQEYKKEYYSRLYKSIVNNPEETLREYLKNNLELPEKFLEIYFLIEMQERNSKYVLDISKIVTSFFDRVKKGLNNDPVERYKFEKINDKKFINDLFDIWYETNIKHIQDIETKVINKRKFLFFTFDKNEKQIERDLESFSKKNMQNHIFSARYFFRIPLINDFFFQNIEMNKTLKIKDLLKRYENIQNVFKKYSEGEKSNTWSRKANLLDQDYIGEMLSWFEAKLKDSYDKEHDEIVEKIKESKNKEYLQKTMTRKLIKGIDDNLINNLPVESINVINEIKILSEQLYEKQLDEETQKMIEFLWKEKLPEIIEKYLNIDNQYRENLKNVQGKTAKELMQESLNVIKKSLQSIEKDINEEILKSFSIHTRYIKSSLKN